MTPQTEAQTAMILAAERMAEAPRPGMQRIEEHADWPLLSRIPMRLTAAVPVLRFKVRDLLALKAGVVVATAWSSMEDVPLRMGQVQLSWSEFEVVEGRMAVRLTRLG